MTSTRSTTCATARAARTMSVDRDRLARPVGVEQVARPEHDGVGAGDLDEVMRVRPRGHQHRLGAAQCLGEQRADGRRLDENGSSTSPTRSAARRPPPWPRGRARTRPRRRRGHAPVQLGPASSARRSSRRRRAARGRPRRHLGRRERVCVQPGDSRPGRGSGCPPAGVRAVHRRPVNRHRALDVAALLLGDPQLRALADDHRAAAAAPQPSPAIRGPRPPRRPSGRQRRRPVRRPGAARAAPRPPGPCRRPRPGRARGRPRAAAARPPRRRRRCPGARSEAGTVARRRRSPGCRRSPRPASAAREAELGRSRSASSTAGPSRPDGDGARIRPAARRPPIARLRSRPSPATIPLSAGAGRAARRPRSCVRWLL